MLRIDRLRRQKGYSLVTWTSVFAVVLATVYFIRTPLKRALQTKISTTADYMFWTKWGDSPRQYKGDKNSFVKTDTTQDVVTAQGERIKGSNKYIRNDAKSTVTENTVSSGVEEGSEAVLKIFDLN